MAGKGDTRRPTDWKKFDEGYNRIWGSRSTGRSPSTKQPTKGERGSTATRGQPGA